MEQLLIKAKALYTGAGWTDQLPAAVLIKNARIQAVGQTALNEAPAGAPVLDCPGLTLMPGMIDCHNHLSLDPNLPDYLLRMQDPVPELTLRAVRTMRMDLMSGVTTSRCLGDKEYLDIHCKKAQAQGLLTGPRLRVATRGIRAPHGHGFVGYPFGGLENIRTAVRENLSAGADLIKIYLTGSLQSSRGLPHTFSKAETELLVNEAHRAGAPVATHCIGGPGLDLALECGIDVIEHGYFITPKQLETMAAGSSWLVLTPSIFFGDARLETLHSGLKADHLAQRDQVARSMELAVSSGVRWAVGTDAMHGGLADELIYLQGFGAKSSDLLAGVTSRAAELMGLGGELGSLEPGKLGDVIGVEGDPLEDLSALKKVRTVVQSGRVIKNASAQADR
jgi:imidazolonepropionase-like amidohydrolase